MMSTEGRRLSEVLGPQLRAERPARGDDDLPRDRPDCGVRRAVARDLQQRARRIPGECEPDADCERYGHCDPLALDAARPVHSVLYVL